jgi:hypothetical protein
MPNGAPQSPYEILTSRRPHRQIEYDVVCATLLNDLCHHAQLDLCQILFEFTGPDLLHKETRGDPLNLLGKPLAPSTRQAFAVPHPKRF